MKDSNSVKENMPEKKVQQNTHTHTHKHTQRERERERERERKERERERERETDRQTDIYVGDIDWLPPACAQTGAGN